MYVRGPWFKDRDPSNAEAVYWTFQPGDPHYPVQTRPPPAQLGPVTPNAASISKASSSNDPPANTSNKKKKLDRKPADSLPHSLSNPTQELSHAFFFGAGLQTQQLGPANAAGAF